jgi:hypothetical protein
MRRLGRIALVVLAASSPMFSQRTAEEIKNVFWQPNELQQGSVAFVTLELEHGPLRVTGKFLDKNLAFFKSDNPKIWYALAGADLETQPGTYDLTIAAVMPGGRVARSAKMLDINAADFGVGEASVPENFVEPDATSVGPVTQLVRTSDS